MSSNSTGTAILASTVISVLVTSLLFLYVFPAVQIGQSGKLIQSSYSEFTNPVNITGNSMTSVPMHNTSVVISTHGNSKLSVEFSGEAILSLGSVFLPTTRFEISLNVGVVGFKKMIIQYSYTDTVPAYTDFPIYVAIQYETGVLPAGSYNISVSWVSVLNVGSSVMLSFSFVNYPRSILVNEIGV